jgi:hypothetical protein
VTIQKINSSRNTATRSTYVGEKGRLFYDEAVGVFYISDGVTPGGRIVPANPNSYLLNGSYQVTLDASGNLTVPGNLTVQGTTSTVNNEIINNNETITGTITINGAGQNLLLYSENFVTGWGSSNSTTVTANATANPLTGTTTASKLVPPNGSTGRKSINIYVTIVPGVKYTYSIYLKAAEYTTATIWWDTTSFAEGGYPGSGNLINLATGAVTGSGSVVATSVGNGWYRCSITATANIGVSTAVQVGVGAVNGGDITANGTSGIYIWGGQVEVAAMPGKYTATTGSAIYNAPALSFSGEDVISLTQTGKLQISVPGTGPQVLFPAGSVSFPSIAFAATNRGIYDSNDGGIGFIGVGWEQARIGTTVGTVNYLSLNGGPTTVGPTLTVGGSDSNTDLNLLAKGTNAINIRSVTSNLFTTTNIFGSGWGTGSATITSTSAVTDPLGGLTAYKLVANVGADPASQSSQQLSGAVLNGILPINVLMTYSIYAKAAEFNQLRIRNNSSGEQYTFTLGTTPTATSGVLNPQSTLITNGWYRISWSYVTGGIGSTVYSRGDNWSLRLASTGDGTSGIYLWGPQLEYGSILNPYTANTTTSPVYYTPKITFNNQSGGIGYSVNGGLYLTPWGIGGLSAQAYDSTTTGGNQRGVQSVDWQMSRSAATQVASGAYSFIGSGNNNTASGTRVTVVGGWQNTNNGYESALLGGSSNSVSGQWATLVAGVNNTAGGQIATIVGGNYNQANSSYNFVGGGYSNITSSGTAATTQTTTATGITLNSTTVTLSSSNASIKIGQQVVGTGLPNPNCFVTAISGTNLTISNAATSTIAVASTLSFYTPHSVIVAGGNNTASGAYSFIGGGGDAGTSGNGNTASGDWSAIVGGKQHLASGLNSFIGGGNANQATGTYTTVAGGINCYATGFGSTVVGGYGNSANGAYSTLVGGTQGTSRSINGMVVFPASVYPLAQQGNSQAGLLILARQTTDTTATVLTSDQSAAAANNQIFLPVNSAYYFKGSVIAGVTGGGNTKAWTFDGAIKKGAANSVAFIGTPTVTSGYADSGASSWSIVLTANTTNDTLTVTVTGQASTTIRWVCKIETTEMTFA